MDLAQNITRNNQYHLEAHQYQPIFGAKTEQNAHRRQDKREQKHRRSGVADRMRIERAEIHNEKPSPINNRYKQTVRNKYTKPQPKEKRKGACNVFMTCDIWDEGEVIKFCEELHV
eukprot:895897_1